MTDKKKGDDGRSGQRTKQGAGASQDGLTRRSFIRSIGSGTLGAALGASLPGLAAA